MRTKAYITGYRDGLRDAKDPLKVRRVTRKENAQGFYMIWFDDDDIEGYQDKYAISVYANSLLDAERLGEHIAQQLLQNEDVSLSVTHVYYDKLLNPEGVSAQDESIIRNFSFQVRNQTFTFADLQAYADYSSSVETGK